MINLNNYKNGLSGQHISEIAGQWGWYTQHGPQPLEGCSFEAVSTSRLTLYMSYARVENPQFMGI
jgi:hypothetical protein